MATKAQERNYNTCPCDVSFNRGDWVYYLDPHILMKKGKFEPRCDEPYLVLHRLSDRTYRIHKISHKISTHIFHKFTMNLERSTEMIHLILIAHVSCYVVCNVSIYFLLGIHWLHFSLVVVMEEAVLLGVINLAIVIASCLWRSLFKIPLFKTWASEMHLMFFYIFR